MIQIQLSEDDFQYDVYTLVKAFFPEEDVKVIIGIEETFQEEPKTLQVRYESEKVTVIMTEQGTILADKTIFFHSNERKEKKNQLKQNYDKTISRQSCDRAESG